MVERKVIWRKCSRWVGQMKECEGEPRCKSVTDALNLECEERSQWRV